MRRKCALKQVVYIVIARIVQRNIVKSLLGWQTNYHKIQNTSKFKKMKIQIIFFVYVVYNYAIWRIYQARFSTFRWK